jgi:hypothetical protein
MIRENRDSRKVVQPPVEAIILGQTYIAVLVTASSTILRDLLVRLV